MGEDGELFKADINGEVFKAQWSEVPENYASFSREFVSWLESMDKAGGLISSSDQGLIILGLGALREPLYLPIELSWSEIAKRAVSNICFGVPPTGLL